MPAKQEVFRKSEIDDSKTYRYFGSDLSGPDQGRNKRGNPRLHRDASCRLAARDREPSARGRAGALDVDRNPDPFLFLR